MERINVDDYSMDHEEANQTSLSIQEKDVIEDTLSRTEQDETIKSDMREQLVEPNECITIDKDHTMEKEIPAEVISSTEKVTSTRIVDIDDNIADKMAPVIVQREEGENVNDSIMDEMLVVGSSQEQHDDMSNRRKSIFPLHERLKGWEIRKKTRPTETRTDKFYFHIQTGIQFRSLNEVDDFIHLGLLPKRPTDKKSVIEKQKPEPKSSVEVSTKTQSRRRRVRSWGFYNKRKSQNRTVIWDIIVGENDNVRCSGEYSETSSSEDTISIEEIDGSEEEVENSTSKETVTEFLANSYENFVNKVIDTADTSAQISAEEVELFLEDSFQNVISPPTKEEKSKKHKESHGEGSSSSKPRGSAGQ